MSIAKVAPASRGLLRLHGWLLMAWVTCIGIGTSFVLLHVFNVHSMAVRYSLGSAAVYFFGFVYAGWWYARWWNKRKAAAGPDLPAHATLQERLAYEQKQETTRKKMDGFDFFDFGGGADDPISFLFMMAGIVLLVILALVFAGYLPMLLTDMLAGYLAEIVLEFVIGAVVVRRVMRPRAIDGYWSYTLRNTGLAGLATVVIFGAGGYFIQQANPQAATLFQLFR